MAPPADGDASLEGWGWDADWRLALEALGEPELLAARVIRTTRRSVELAGIGDPESRARVPGRILRQGPMARPAVGDWVAVRRSRDDLEVEAVLPRRSLFRRRAAGRGGGVQLIAANVDAVLLVMGLDADFNLRRMERYLALSSQSGARPIIVLNKRDLAEDLAHSIAQVESVAAGAPVVAVSAKRGEGLGLLAPHLRAGTTLALLGSSGVGKSTLVNELVGKPMQPTAEVRERDGRGRHTTTAREMIRLEGDVLLIDTPGMRELGLWADDEGALDDTFDDVAQLAAACRFRDCRHTGEPGCAVRAALDEGELPEERLSSYQKLRREVAGVAQIAREKEARFKAIGKELRRRRKDEDR